MHHELEGFKEEIVASPEPQQMRDVQANLQILETRETLMTRQVLMMLANLEAVRAASELNRRAQEEMLYSVFVGETDWVGGESRHQVRKFLRMPGQ